MLSLVTSVNQILYSSERMWVPDFLLTRFGDVTLQRTGPWQGYGAWRFDLIPANWTV